MNESLPLRPARPRLSLHSPLRPLREIVDTIVWVALLFTLVNLATARYVVEGISMSPNFHTGEYILVSRISYLLGQPQRGDIVVFHYPRNPTRDYIKRVIGVPGDTVELRDRQVFVNGTALNESYINGPCGAACPDRLWEIGLGEVFVMGDNRNHSSDSRAFGPVSQAFIVGEALLRYFPLSHVSIVESFAYPK